MLINVYQDTRSRTDAHAVKHQGEDVYQIIEYNFDYSIVAGHHFPDSAQIAWYPLKYLISCINLYACLADPD